MRLSIAAALLVSGVLFHAPALRAAEQVVQDLTAPEEQRIEVIAGDEDLQQVEIVGGSVEQTVGVHEPPSPSEKAASKAGKFMLGVASAGVALGVMAASLLLL